MIVVCDTSPVSNLMTIGKLDVLQVLFERIILPEAVAAELSVIGSHRRELMASNWIVVRAVKDRILVDELMQVLDPGESEAIALALEQKADYLVIDERKGRQIAREYGLKMTGLLGVLMTAKSKGIIQEIAPLIDDLVVISGFRIHPQLRAKILKDVGEVE